MVYFLYGYFFSRVWYCVAVLLQPGKTDAGALFTSNVSSSALAPRGTATVLVKDDDRRGDDVHAFGVIARDACTDRERFGFEQQPGRAGGSTTCDGCEYG